MKREEHLNKWLPIVLATITMLSILFAASITVNATSGPSTSKKTPGGIAIGFTRFDDWEVMYRGDSGKKSASFEGFKYDKSSNTLTIKDTGTDEEYYLQLFDMGDDFKLKVVGKNSLGYIATYSNVKDRMNLTITGSGTLTVNKMGGYGAAIHAYANGKSNSKITIDNTVNLNLYGGENVFEGTKEKVIMVDNAKSSKKSNIFKIGGKKTGKTTINKKKTKKGYSYTYGAYKLIIKKSGKSFLTSPSSSSSSSSKKTTKTYKVKYNLNGGKGSIEDQTKTKGKNLKLSTKKPTRSGYTFKGWSVKKNGSLKYKAGDTYKEDSSVTLYAKWRKNKIYVLIYGAAKGETPSSTNNVNMMYRALKQLKVPGYSISEKNVVKINKKSFKKSEFKNAVEEAFKDAEKNDLCFVYLNTHSKGVVDANQKIKDYYTGELKDKIKYLGLSTGPQSSNYYSWKQVLTDMGSRIKGKIIFMPEVCNSGKFISYVEDTKVRDRMIILAAADSDKGAHQTEIMFFGGGNYTQVLAAGLGFYWKTPIVDRLVADKNKNGKVTVEELYAYIVADRRVVGSGQSPQLYVPYSMNSFVLYKD